MGDFINIIQKIQSDKNYFIELVEKMNPLINKYMRLLYKDEKDDVRSELFLALWEAILKMEYFDNEGQCINYLTNALKNKFYELYRKSAKVHDNEYLAENTVFLDVPNIEDPYLEYILRSDLENIVNQYSGKKKKICLNIIETDQSDLEIAEIYNVSKQYVNRLRRFIYNKLKDQYI